jgi:hypothetical protein
MFNHFVGAAYVKNYSRVEVAFFSGYDSVLKQKSPQTLSLLAFDFF